VRIFFQKSCFDIAEYHGKKKEKEKRVRWVFFEKK
jgi:hypothetical protein